MQFIPNLKASRPLSEVCNNLAQNCRLVYERLCRCWFTARIAVSVISSMSWVVQTAPKVTEAMNSEKNNHNLSASKRLQSPLLDFLSSLFNLICPNMYDDWSRAMNPIHYGAFDVWFERLT